MTVGERIKARRKELGMNAESLAKKLGCAPSTIYRYESGSIEKVDSEKLIPIAEALATSPAALMGWTDDIRHKPEQEPAKTSDAPKTKEARIISGGIDKMPEAARKRAVQFYELFFAEYAEFFKDEEGEEDK